MRVFTAVDIENPKLLNELETVRDELDYGFNNVSKPKMHLTLQFFQDVNQKKVKLIADAMEHVETGCFNLNVAGIGVFPSRRNVRVIWAGADTEEVFNLKKQVSQHRVPEENNHDFRPHITVSRVNSIPRNKRKEFRQKLKKFQNRNFGTTEVNKVKLFESVYKGQSTEYQVLKEVKL